MKAMILAAGKGTRMRPITLTTPKPMIPIVNKPVMQLIIEHLRKFNINDFVVNTSYLPEKIQEYFGDGSPLGVNIAYSFEGYIEKGEMKGVALGSAGGMKKIQEISGVFDSTFIVVCGDAYIDFDIDEMYRQHKANGAIASILTKEVPKEEVSKYGVVVTDSHGKITQFQEKPPVEEALSDQINTGIYMFEPEIFNHIPSETEYDIGGELFPELVRLDLPFFGFCQDFQWIDMGALPDVFQCQSLVLNKQVEGLDLPGKEIAEGIHCNIHSSIDPEKSTIIGPVYFASGVIVEEGATIEGPTVIGANCVIEKDAKISRCFIDQNKRIRSGAILEDMILHDKYAISKNGSVHDLRLLRCEWMVDDVRNADELGEYERLLQEEMQAQAG